MVGRWGLKDGLEQNRKELKEVGASEVWASFAEMRESLAAKLPEFVVRQQRSIGEIRRRDDHATLTKNVQFCVLPRITHTFAEAAKIEPGYPSRYTIPQPLRRPQI